MKPRTVLFIGYGNPGRLDDGLGPAAADAVARMAIPGVTVDSDYQLTLEVAEAVARHDVVVFADAADTGPEVAFRELTTVQDSGFSTHSVTPEQVMGLARGLFGADTRAYVLAVRGYEFNEYEERISDGARSNLDRALRFLEGALPDLVSGADVPDFVRDCER